ncbi:PREDICTED: amphoterin-induced protein 2-like [Branchiostoma belcheri]|uniref:Amphoterin-induced protein 2-like n=1 Tax=Branchiostoma belcheri TaxID=7741 RepID=A0A6P4Z242_BRABE|nr:PREDICTED: amphoterin-induced protein 2-like [Branchiostoma belcheri]
MQPTTSLFVLTLLTTTVGKTVDYTGRKLTHVPIDSIASDAHTVRLSDNEISHLGSFHSTPHIRYLFMDNNRVNNLSPQTFQTLRELLVLDLDRNDIGTLRDFTFSALATLSDLLLSNNLISAISERAFHGLASLEFLELSGNRLSVFPREAIRLIPSKQLMLVLLMVNNISRIPGDIKSLHPSASYQFQGNPLLCPEEDSSRDDSPNVENVSVWPNIRPYGVNTLRNRTLVMKFFFIKGRHNYFGVLPNTFYVNEHYDFNLPEVAVERSVGYYVWNTPTGRRLVPATKALEVEDFLAEDSGMYTCVRDKTGDHHVLPHRSVAVPRSHAV